MCSSDLGPGLDPCAALGLSLVLQAGSERTVTVLLGHGDSPEAARSLLAEAKAELKERMAGRPYACPIPTSVELPFKRRPDSGMPLGGPIAPHVAGPLSRAKLPT